MGQESQILGHPLLNMGQESRILGQNYLHVLCRSIVVFF